MNHILVYIVEVFVKTTKYAYLCFSFLCNELQNFITERHNGMQPVYMLKYTKDLDFFFFGHIVLKKELFYFNIEFCNQKIIL